MDPNQILRLGPVQLPVHLLVLLIGLVLSTFLTERMARKRNWVKDKWTDLVISVSLLFIFFYKFGWIIFDLKRVIQSPASIIWNTSSTRIILLGAVVTMVFLIYKVRKNKYPIYDVLDFIWLIVAVTMFVYNLVIIDYGKVTTSILGIHLAGQSSYLYHPVNWYRALLIGILLIIRFRYWKDSIYTKQLYILLGVGLLTISIFNISIHLTMGFTAKQWLYLAITFIGILGYMKNK